MRENGLMSMAEERRQFERLLDEVLAQLEFKLQPDQVAVLFQHYTLLRRWNRRINLTGIRNSEDIVQRHFGESLLVAKVIGSGTGQVVDVGSGAGFPGVPIAVSWPGRSVVLVESVAKKAAFLKEIARQVGNITVQQKRFEEFSGAVEWVTLRGVAVDGVWERIRLGAERVAVTVSTGQVSEMQTRLGLESAVQHKVPWETRTTVLEGKMGGLSSTWN